VKSRKSYQNSRYLLTLASGILIPFLAHSQPGYAQQPANTAVQSFQLPAPAGTPAAPNQPLSVTAGSVDARLQIYDVPLEHVGNVGAKLQLQFGADKRVRITNEPNSGRLMVLAPEATQRQIAQAVEAVRKQVGSLNMDARGNVVPSQIQQNQYKLQRTTWRELEDAIGRLAGPRLTITTSNNGELAQLKLVNKDSVQEVMQVDRRNDEVRLQGTPSNVMAWTQVVTAIDIGQADPARPTQIVPITPATPERIERAIKLVKLASYQQPAQEDQATGAARMTPPGVGDDAPATAIGTPEGLSTGSGLIGDVDISFVPEMGLVIVKGSKKDVQRVLEVIEQIKKQSVDTAPEIELYPLKHVNSQALGVIIKELNDEVFSKRQGQVSITALGQPNSLLLIGRPEALVGIKELIGKLDQPIEPNSQLRVYKFVNASAIDAETLIKNFFGDTTTTANQNTTTSSNALNPRIKAVADYRTNSLIVQASPRDQAEVARLVKEIDTDSSPAESEIKVFSIKYAVASELQPILQSAITGESNSTTGGGQQQQQQGGNNSSSSRANIPNSRLSIITRKDGSPVDSGLLSGVVVTSNPGTNTLIVRAPSKSMPLIKALIDQLDMPPSVDARIKVFEVINGDASSLATTLQQAFGLPTTGTNTQTNNNGLGGLFGFANAGGLTAGGDSSLVPLRIATETRTNSIIVSGSQSDLEVIEVLLLRLDEDNARQRITEVIWLRNSAAADVAAAITSLITSQRTTLNNISPPVQAGQATGQVFSVNERIEREVFVVAEPATNSLIISAMPRYLPQIREVIERLDRQQPMIAVEILIAEVTLDDNFDLGTEFGLQDSLLFDRNSASGGTLGSPGFNVINPLSATTPAAQQRRTQNVAGQGSSGFALGRSNSTLGYGGLVLAAGSESVSMLFRALQDANRVQILSRPQLMTIDNNIASVQVGQQVPRLGGTTVTAGISQQSVTDVPVGLIMQIQPRTNQDGLINMIVAVTRSSLGPTDSGVPIGFGPNGETVRSPVINTTQAQTRVTAYDGQTVVLSGLITKTRSTRSRRIPWLADIPFAGALFRFDSQSESRTELLVVMTPRIINYNNEEKLEMIKQVESSRMSYCLADVLNIHGDVGLSPGNGLWGPAASPVIYPDLQPTVERDPRYAPRDMIIGEPELMNNAPPPVDPAYETGDGYSMNAPVRSNVNGARTLINQNGDQAPPAVNSASPIQNSSFQPGIQQGAYGVAPASYQPISQPAARVANGR
jgi:type II secretion system protein D